MSRTPEYSFFDSDWGRYSSQHVAHVPTPEGFNAVGQTARIHAYQDPTETKPIGVPGTTLNQGHPDDKIISIGGNHIIMGAAPGAETVRIQGKGGAAVEMSSDGRLNMVSAKGLHISAQGDGQWLISGDLCMTATGALLLKAGSMHLDTTDFILNASGNIVMNAGHDYNLNVSGDNHTTTQGDKSDVTAGTFRQLVSGQTLIQSHERIKISTNKSYELAAKQTGFLSCMDTLTLKSDVDVQLAARRNYQAKAMGKITQDSGEMTIHTAGSDYSVNAVGKYNETVGGTLIMSAKGNIEQHSDVNIFDSAAGAHVIASDTISHYAKIKITHTTPILHSAATTSWLYITPEVAGATPSPNDKVSAASVDGTPVNLARVKVECPTDEEVAENTKQFSAKRTDYALPHVNGGVGGIHAISHDSETNEPDPKIKKEVDRHYGAGEYDKYAKTADAPLPFTGQTDETQVSQNFYANEHTGLA